MLQFFAQPFSRRVKRATRAPRARPLWLHLEELERREVPAAIALQNSVIPMPEDTTPANVNVVPNGNELQVIGAPGNAQTDGLLGSPTTGSPLNASNYLLPGWSGWSASIGGTTDHALGSAVFNSRLYLFAKGAVGNAIFVNSRGAGTNWSGWSEVPGGGATDEAVSPVVFNGQLYLFAKGLGNGIFVNSMDENGGWSGWSASIGGTTDHALGLAVFSGRLYLFAKGEVGNAIFVNSMDEDGGWSGWGEVPGGGATDEAVSPVVFNGQLYLFAKGLGNGIFVNSMDAGTNWSGWSEVPGGGATDEALSPVVFNRQLYLFAKGLGNGIFVNSTTGGSLTATNTQVLFAAAQEQPPSGQLGYGDASPVRLPPLKLGDASVWRLPPLDIFGDLLTDEQKQYLPPDHEPWEPPPPPMPFPDAPDQPPPPTLPSPPNPPDPPQLPPPPPGLPGARGSVVNLDPGSLWDFVPAASTGLR
jgi:hypothetical protein